ncbi:SH3 domain-containing protein [Aureimonas altamirensis]|uniref:SH3 domain-containing protein n=1 Tax=Aureimonas altamirensis TaxID=370622 RepID=UPI003AFAC7B3
MAKKPKAIGGRAVAATLAVLWGISSLARNDAPAPTAHSPASVPKALLREAEPRPSIPSRTTQPPTPTAPANERTTTTSETAYTTARLRVRAEPSTTAETVTTLDRGQPVTIAAKAGAWRLIKSGSVQGWAHGDYLSNRPPVAEAARPAPLRIEQPARRSAPSPPAALMDMRRSGQPLRDPYVGRCDCPYDRMRNGRRCGGNSAFSRPGGASPQCYF